MRVAVKLIGFQAFSDVQKDLVEGSLSVVLPDTANTDDLLEHLAARYWSVFAAGKRPGAGGLTRISVFVDNEMIEDPQSPLANKLRPQSEITVSLLRPLRGG